MVCITSYQNYIYKKILKILIRVLSKYKTKHTMDENIIGGKSRKSHRSSASSSPKRRSSSSRKRSRSRSRSRSLRSLHRKVRRLSRKLKSSSSSNTKYVIIPRVRTEYKYISPYAYYHPYVYKQNYRGYDCT